MPITARRVVQLAAQHGVVGLVEVDPAHGHAELLALAGEPVAVRHVGQVAGQEDPQRLARPRRARSSSPSGRPSGRPRGRPPRAARAPRPATGARRRRPAGPPGSSHSNVPTGWRYCWMSSTRSRSSSATIATAPGCCDVLAADRPALTEVDRVADDVPDHPLEDPLAVLDRATLEPVDQLLAARGRRPERHGADTVSAGAWRSTSTSREARWASIAAPDQARRTAGAPGAAATGTPGAPGSRRSTGARRRAARRTRPACRPGRCRRTRRPASSSCVAVGVVDLVAVAVPLVDRAWRRRSRASDRPSARCGRVGAEAHRAAEVAGALDERLLLLHRRDDRVRRARGRTRWSDASAMPATLRAYSMTMHCRPRQMPRVGTWLLAGPLQGAELALDAADAEAARHEHGVDAAERLLGAGLGLALVAGHPADAHLGVVVEAAGAHRLGDREVGVGQVDVLADQGDLDVVLGVVHPAQQLVPVGPVDVAEGQAEPADDVGVEALARAGPWGCRRCSARRRSWRRPSVSTSHISEILRLIVVGDVAVGAQHDARRAGCRPGAAPRPSAGSAWSSARRSGRGRAPARRAGRRRCRGRRRGAPGGRPRGTAATRCRRRCRRSR